MPQQKIENLMSELHTLFGAEESTAAQDELLQQLAAHVHGVNEPEPQDLTPLETLEVMVEDLEVSHPTAAALVREILVTLRNMGI